jgi:hypothetical protein
LLEGMFGGAPAGTLTLSPSLAILGDLVASLFTTGDPNGRRVAPCTDLSAELTRLWITIFPSYRGLAERVDTHCRGRYPRLTKWTDGLWGRRPRLRLRGDPPSKADLLRFGLKNPE